MARHSGRRALTLVELVLVTAIGAIAFLLAPPMILHSVRTMVFLPRAAGAEEAAQEMVQQVIEGGFSDVAVTGKTTVQGVRFATRRAAGDPAIWYAGGECVGYRLTWEDGLSRYIFIRREGARLRRSAFIVRPACPAGCVALTAQEELIPRQAPADLTITPTGSFFQYVTYDAAGNEAPSGAGCLPSPQPRRVDIRFVAQTGTGNPDLGHAREAVMSSVAIRTP